MKRNASRILMFVLALLMVIILTAIPTEVSAAASASGTVGGDINWAFDAATGTLTISGNGDMRNTDASFSQCKHPWSEYADQVTSVVIEEGVTQICYNAFSGFSKVTSLSIPNSVTSVEDFVFGGFSALQEIYIPAGLADMGIPLWGDSMTAIWVDPANPSYSSDQYGVLFNKDKTQLIDMPPAFSGSYTIPAGVTSFSFSHCRNLTSVTVPTGAVGDFYYCTSLKSVTLPSYATEIGTFFGCSALDNVIIPQGVTSIPGTCFGDCGLTSITIPSTVTSIGTRAFYDCDNLTSITIPEGVTFLDGNAFANCDNLQSVSLPSTLTEMGNAVFYECPSLSTVNIPNNLATIPVSTFLGCSSLKSITIPACVTMIEDYAFDTTGLKEVTFLGDAPEFGDDEDDVFYDVTATAYYPAGNTTWDSRAKVNHGGRITWVATCGNHTFASPSYQFSSDYKKCTSTAACTTSGCEVTQTQTVTCSVSTTPATCTQDGKTDYVATFAPGVSRKYTVVHTAIGHSYENMVCLNCGSAHPCSNGHTWGQWYTASSATCSEPGYRYHTCSVCKEYASEEVPATGEHTYQYDVCTACGTPGGTLGDNLDWVFDRATGTLTVSGEGEMERLPGSANFPWNNLRDDILHLVIEEGVTTISYEAFFQCRNMVSADLPSTLTQIGMQSFQYCYALKEITAPASIGANAFQQCYALESVTLLDGAKTIAKQAFYNCTSLSSVVIPASVTTMYEYAFSGCDKLTTAGPIGGDYDIQFGWTTSIPAYAFRGCDLVEITFPNNLTTIGTYAFASLNITDLVLPDTVTTIGSYAFSFNYDLERVVLPASLANTDFGIFYNCTNLTSAGPAGGDYAIQFRWTGTIPQRALGGSPIVSLTIPGSITTIDDYAFQQCNDLETVTISRGATTIGYQAFALCPNLTTMVIPASVTTIEEKAFRDDQLTDVYYGGTQANWTKLGSYAPKANYVHYGYTNSNGHWTSHTQDVTCNTDGYTYSSCPCGYETEHQITQTSPGHNYVDRVCTRCGDELLPEGLYYTVGDTSVAITGYTGTATELEIPATIGGKPVTTIQPFAFSGCAGLQSIDIPDSVTFIGNYAFQRCTGLHSIVIPSKAVLDHSVFAYCSGLESVTLPSTMASIPAVLFFECTSLKTVDIPDTVTAIDPQAFMNCTSLESIEIPYGVTEISADTFSGCTNLKSVIIPNSVTTIYESAFSDCSSLQTIDIPSTVESIGRYAFQDCSGLTEIVLPPISAIAEGTFSGCTSLESIVLPSSVKTIGNAAFGSSGVKTVFYPGTTAQKNAIEGISASGLAGDEVTWHYEVEEMVFADQDCFYCAQCDTCVLPDGSYPTVTVEFLDYDGTVLSSGEYRYHQAVTAPDDPSRTHENPLACKYVFTGWDKDLEEKCEGSATYTAQYKEEYIDYTVTFLDEDGTLICQETYHYGDTVTVPADPSKAADMTYTYEFDGWDSDVAALCGGSVTYTATYRESYIDYTVTFLDEDGTLISLESYHYGDTVTVPADPSKVADKTYTYEFDGWDSDVAALCGGNATYTATYQESYIDYTVTFLDEDGTLISQEIYHYGDTITIPADPTKPAANGYAYTFTGWGQEVSSTCQGTVTYTARYEARSTILIITQPQDVTAAKNKAIKLTVAAEGEGLAYQWYYKKVGAASFTKSSQTTATYTNTMNADRDGWLLYCVITDANGNTVTTNTVTITMKKVLPVITSQPQDVTAANGKLVRITVGATGDGLTYTWYFKKPGSSTFSASAQNTATYSTTMTAARNGYQYYCVVTNADGYSVQTNTVTITLDSTAPVITTQPQSVTAANGTSINLTVAAEGDGLTYQWYYKKVGAASFTKSSQTTATYTNTMNATRNGWQLYCVVTNANGISTQTNTVTIELEKTIPVITIQPQSVTAANGASINLTVAAEGDGLTYQWYYKKVGAASFTKSSQTTATYTNTMNATRNGWQLYCVITDASGGSVQTNTVTISMEETDLVINSQPQNVTAANGQLVRLTVSASGDGLTYTWYFKKPSDSTFSASTQNTATYSTTMTAYRNGYQYYCVVTDASGNSVQTNTVTITLSGGGPVITSQPQDVTAANGQLVRLTVGASGDGLTYTWYFKKPSDSTFSASTQNSASYTTTMNATRNGYQYYCVVSDANGVSVTSNTVTITLA